MPIISERLQKAKTQGVFRTLSLQSTGIDFQSNDYLGFSRNIKIREALKAAIDDQCPLGSTGSRLLSGHTEYHERVESFLQNIYQVPSALLYPCGYSANIGVMTALGTEDTEFFSDAFNHASLVDGQRLTKACRTIFAHNDASQLEYALQNSKKKLKVIVTESVFSMDGDVAPLAELIDLAHRYGAMLVVDEAHSTGVFGVKGLGCISNLDTKGVELIRVHTASKALGGQGAFVLSSVQLRELFINCARSFIFTTALAPLMALQIEFALREVLQQTGLGANLLKVSEQVRTRLKSFMDVGKSSSQIIPVILADNKRVTEISNLLCAQGVALRAIKSPTVPKGTERLRITLKAFHSAADITRMQDALIRAVST